MSIAGYLTAGTPEAPVVRKRGEEAGIEFKAPEPFVEEYYYDAGDYDPVLRAHCRP